MRWSRLCTGSSWYTAQSHPYLGAFSGSALQAPSVSGAELHESCDHRLRSWLQAVLGDDALRELSRQFSPHTMFLHFLHITGFDPTFLLDLLIGNETPFLAYFIEYVTYRFLRLPT